MELFAACVSPEGQVADEEENADAPPATPGLRSEQAESLSFNFEAPLEQESNLFEQLVSAIRAPFGQSGERGGDERPSSEVTIRSLCREAEDEASARRIEKRGREAAVASINAHLDEYLKGSSGNISCKSPACAPSHCPSSGPRSTTTAPPCHGSHRARTPTHSRGLDLADPSRERRFSVEREQQHRPSILHGRGDLRRSNPSWAVESASGSGRSAAAQGRRGQHADIALAGA